MNLSSHSARSTTSTATPLRAPTHEVDSSEDEQDRNEEESHIHVQEQKIPLMNTDTIQRVENGEGTQKLYLFHLNIFISHLWLQRSDLCQSTSHLSCLLL